MPTELKNYYESVQKKQDEIRESVVASVKGDATKSRGLGIYISGVIAALVAGVAIGL
jgi:hypothetical protein